MKKVLALVAMVAFAGSLFAQTPVVKTEKVKAPAKKEAAKPAEKKAAPAEKKAEKPVEKKAPAKK